MALTDKPLAEPMLSLRAYRGEYGAHSHAHAQVLVGVRGSLQLEVEGHPAFVDPSCGLVIPAGARHGYLADAPAQKPPRDHVLLATLRLLPPRHRQDEMPGTCLWPPSADGRHAKLYIGTMRRSQLCVVPHRGSAISPTGTARKTLQLLRIFFGGMSRPTALLSELLTSLRRRWLNLAARRIFGLNQPVNATNAGACGTRSQGTAS